MSSDTHKNGKNQEKESLVEWISEFLIMQDDKWQSCVTDQKKVRESVRNPRSPTVTY
jgi:hypothetical protein